MVPGITSSTIRETQLLVIINIYGARVISPLFCAHQITES